MRDALAIVGFFWTATRGHRLRPWRSPYLRWRFETYTGKPAATVGFKDFAHLVVTERRQFRRFLGWLGEMKEHALGGGA